MAARTLANKARPSYRDDMPANVRSRMQRGRMICEWAFVLDMLNSGKRKHRDGRTLTEVWADLVLENPAQEFARVAKDLLLPETPEASAGAGAVTNVQALYLLAVQGANRETALPGGAISDATSHKTIEGVAEQTQGANGVQPPLSDW